MILIQPILDRLKRDFGGGFDRKTIGATAQRRKRDAFTIVFRRGFQALQVGLLQHLSFMRRPLMPDGANGMNNDSRRQVSRYRNNGSSHLAAHRVFFSRILENLGTALAMNNAVDSAPSGQARVSRIDDSVHTLLGDVPKNQLNRAMAHGILHFRGLLIYPVLVRIGSVRCPLPLLRHWFYKICSYCSDFLSESLRFKRCFARYIECRIVFRFAVGVRTSDAGSEPAPAA